MNQKEFFGYGSINYLGEILQKEKVKNIFLVTGKASYESCGAKAIVEKIFGETNCKSIRFSELTPNPSEDQIQAGFNLFLESLPDLIVSVGGGSSIDVAKEIKLRFFKKTLKVIPLVAIPTTAGSGSEATYFTVFYKEKEKQSGGEKDLTLPEYSIIDPTFTLELPREIAASTGLDALGQAIESYWCINSSSESKEIARNAIVLLWGNLERAVNSKDKEEIIKAKEKVMLGANLAGKAINLTKTTACHSIAYPLTSYFNISHGHAVALTLGEMLVYNSQVSQDDCSDPRGKGYVFETIRELIKILGTTNPEQAKENINILIEKLSLERKLSNLGLIEKDLDLIVENSFNPERVKNNPRKITKDKLKRFLSGIY